MQQKWNQNFDGEPMADIPQKFLNAGCDVYMVMQLRHDDAVPAWKQIFHRGFFRHAATASPYKHRTLRSETSAGCLSWVHRQNSGSIFAASSTSQF